MSVEIRVPPMGESVSSATIARWLKKPGDSVKIDEPLVSLDSDKATVEVPSPAAGILGAIAIMEGEVKIGQVLGHIVDSAIATLPVASSLPTVPVEAPSSPSVRRVLTETGVNPADIQGTGKGGRLSREDVAQAVARRDAPAPVVAPVVAPVPAPVVTPVVAPVPAPVFSDHEEIVPMTTLRKRIAERLVQSQQTAAILTTFNEVDMSAVMALRERYQERFLKKYGIKLGFMSFFVKAAIDALKAFPSANAEIRGDNIVYKHYYHIGVAVSGPRGLVVPVLRNADQLSFAETEKAIAAFGEKARASKLGVDDLQGGSFTISNGGIFGSMMSTPILNPPQVAILGMHAIQKRAVVVDDQIVIRPMMYLAVSYDHRLLDGREAVSFLVRIKECIENPERVLLEV